MTGKIDRYLNTEEYQSDRNYLFLPIPEPASVTPRIFSPEYPPHILRAEYRKRMVVDGHTLEASEAWILTALPVGFAINENRPNWASVKK